MPDDDDILEISAEDLAAEPDDRPDDSAPLLDISLEDLADEAPPAAEVFPVVTADQLLAARSSIVIRTLCSTTGRPFEVRYVEDQPGVFKTAQVTVLEPGGDVRPLPYAVTGRVEGSFEVSPDYACPHCGSRAVLVCGQCGVDLCAGAPGPHDIVCPGCQARVKIGGRATSATGLLGKGKGQA